MVDQLYDEMTVQQASDALDTYLAEQEPARQRLRSTLADHGNDPAEMLDGSVYSVSPLWVWITARAAELGIDPHTLFEDPTRPTWPSWARHGKLVDPHPPAETLFLIDGFAAYLADVLTAQVPEAVWQIGHHQIADYPMLHYPVLAAGLHEIFLPAVPLYSAYQSAHGRDPMSGTEMLTHVRRTITALRGEGPVATAAEDPPVTVVAEIDCFDVGLRADIAEHHPEVVKQMIDELCDRDGVDSVHRYGPAALVVNAPQWDQTRLKLWATMWLQRHLPR